MCYLSNYCYLPNNYYPSSFCYHAITFYLSLGRIPYLQTRYENCVAGTCRAADQIKSDVDCVESLYLEGGSEYKKIGSNMKVTLYLRNRCQMYHEYSHVLDCTKSDTWVDWAQHKKYMYFRYCILLLRAPSRLYRRRYFQVNSIKYSFFSICRDLDYVHYFAPLQSQHFSKCSSTCLMII